MKDLNINKKYVLILTLVFVLLVIVTIIWWNENSTELATTDDKVIAAMSENDKEMPTVSEVIEYEDRIEWIKYEDGLAVKYTHIFYIENDTVTKEEIYWEFVNKYEAKCSLDKFQSIANNVRIEENILRGIVKYSDSVGYTKQQIKDNINEISKTYKIIE